MLVQTFELQTPNSKTKLKEFIGNDHELVALREYMFSMYRIQALDRLVKGQTTGQEVMQFMSNTHVLWSEFRNKSIRVTTSNLVDLIDSFESAKIENREPITSFIKELCENRPPGILMYAAIF